MITHAMKKDNAGKGMQNDGGMNGYVLSYIR